jgi:hypothetical protein
MTSVRDAQYVLRWIAVVEASSRWMQGRYPRVWRALLGADPTSEEYVEFLRGIQDVDGRLGRTKRGRRTIDGR